MYKKLTKEECVAKIDRVVEKIEGAIKRAMDNLPKKRLNKSSKPYWNKELSRLAKQKKRLWSNWINGNKPRNGPIYVVYKETKKEFRNACHKAIYNYEVNNMKKSQMQRILAKNISGI